MVAEGDLRFSVPLYTQAEAARYLDMPATTFRTWTQGYERRPSGRSAVRGSPLVAYIKPRRLAEPSVPFVGLAEGMFLSALRRANVPLQQIRPALNLVRERLGVAHALASKRLYVVGAQLLWEVAEEGDLGPGARRALIVLRNGQYVFRDVIESYLKRIDYADDGYAARVELPGFEVATVFADPTINFGHPFFAATGAPVDAVLSRLRAGESLFDVADDFDLSSDEVAEVADRAELTAA
ncbi:DUF433 domain-containing protein [Planosporangium sp. 12N6]|uniref:DUF433 domain-containing protein n=1 Tax=Planosporangium spinosum TaxID=3402278 RepID=UPI003CF54847